MRTSSDFTKNVLKLARENPAVKRPKNWPRIIVVESAKLSFYDSSYFDEESGQVSVSLRPGIGGLGVGKGEQTSKGE